MKYIIVFVFLSMFSSCDSAQKNIIGFWSIEDIIYINKDIKDRISFNAISFRKNGECSLPQFDWQGSKEGQWKIITTEKGKHLVVHSPYSIFNGRYQFNVYNDSVRRVFKMQLISDSVQITCSKFFHSYKE